MALQSERALDSIDWKILRELQADARLSFNELARRIGLSSPAVAERVRRMEDAGVIAGYHAQVDPSKVGLPVMALIQMRCAPGKCLLKTASPGDYPELLDMVKVSGPHCSVLKVAAASIPHLEDLFERLGMHGELLTSMVWSSALNRRVLDGEAITWEGGAATEWR
ncbi:MAG: Lrp/AsnC family transcriptional regulator [Thermomicrobiales bacterium]